MNEDDKYLLNKSTLACVTDIVFSYFDEFALATFFPSALINASPVCFLTANYETA